MYAMVNKASSMVFYWGFYEEEEDDEGVFEELVGV